MIRRTVLLLLVLILTVTILTAVPVLAQTPKQPVVAVQFSCDILDPGTSFQSGDILHIRNQVVLERKVSDHALLNGWDEVTLNMELNTVTGKGTVHGTSIYKPDLSDDHFEGSLTGRIKNFVFSGRGISRGTGELEGLIGLVMAIEQIPVPENPPCPAMETYNLIGYMIDTRHE